MSKGQKICFDASIRNGVVGIGIWDYSTKFKKYVSFPSDNPSSYIAEKMALAVAMEYAHSKKYINPYYFTDNSKLAEEGIPNKFKIKYGTGRLHWIPREFNKEADELSKKGSDVISKVSISSLEDNKTETFNLILKLSDYTFERKINFLKRIATQNCETIFVDLITAKGKGHYPASYMKRIKNFVYIATNIFKKEELSKYTRKRINKIKTDNPYLRQTNGMQKTLTDFIRSRNTI